jgi:hypothetical protein
VSNVGMINEYCISKGYGRKWFWAVDEIVYHHLSVMNDTTNENSPSG